MRSRSSACFTVLLSLCAFLRSVAVSAKRQCNHCITSKECQSAEQKLFDSCRTVVVNEEECRQLAVTSVHVGGFRTTSTTKKSIECVLSLFTDYESIDEVDSVCRAILGSRPFVGDAIGTASGYPHFYSTASDDVTRFQLQKPQSSCCYSCDPLLFQTGNHLSFVDNHLETNVQSKRQLQAQCNNDPSAEWSVSAQVNQRRACNHISLIRDVPLYCPQINTITGDQYIYETCPIQCAAYSGCPLDCVTADSQVRLPGGTTCGTVAVNSARCDDIADGLFFIYVWQICPMQCPIRAGCTTSEPTASPVFGTVPTVTPTFSLPTESPFVAPFSAPTESPTDAPVPAPTASPTDAPIPAPTRAPNPAPTASPTDAPLQVPVPVPVTVPTPIPVFVPVGVPVQAPVPIPVPVPAPVPIPTSAPVTTPVSVPAPLPVPVPVPMPISVPVPAPAPLPVSSPAPLPAPVPLPVNSPNVVPVEAPVPVPVPAPVPLPVNPPIVSMPAPVPNPVPVDAPLSVPVNQPVALPVDTSIPVPVSQPVALPVLVPVPVDSPVSVPLNSPLPVPVDPPVAVAVPTDPIPVSQPVFVPVDSAVPVPLNPPVPMPVNPPPVFAPVDTPVVVPANQPIPVPVDTPIVVPISQPIPFPVAAPLPLTTEPPVTFGQTMSETPVASSPSGTEVVPTPVGVSEVEVPVVVNGDFLSVRLRPSGNLANLTKPTTEMVFVELTLTPAEELNEEEIQVVLNVLKEEFDGYLKGEAETQRHLTERRLARRRDARDLKTEFVFVRQDMVKNEDGTSSSILVYNQTLSFSEKVKPIDLLSSTDSTESPVDDNDPRPNFDGLTAEQIAVMPFTDYEANVKMGQRLKDEADSLNQLKVPLPVPTVSQEEENSELLSVGDVYSGDVISEGAIAGIFLCCALLISLFGSYGVYRLNQEVTERRGGSSSRSSR